MNKKSFIFGIILLVTLTVVVSVPVTIYLYEPVERNVKHMASNIIASSNDGWYEGVTGYINYIEVSNRVGSFKKGYEYHVTYDKIHNENASYIINTILNRFDNGGTLRMNGHFYLSSPIYITHSYTNIIGGNYTVEPTISGTRYGFKLYNKNYCSFSDMHFFDYKLNAYDEWMRSK